MSRLACVGAGGVGGASKVANPFPRRSPRPDAKPPIAEPTPASSNVPMADPYRRGLVDHRPSNCRKSRPRSLRPHEGAATTALARRRKPGGAEPIGTFGLTVNLRDLRDLACCKPVIAKRSALSKRCNCLLPAACYTTLAHRRCPPAAQCRAGTRPEKLSRKVRSSSLPLRLPRDATMRVARSPRVDLGPFRSCKPRSCALILAGWRDGEVESMCVCMCVSPLCVIYLLLICTCVCSDCSCVCAYAQSCQSSGVWSGSRTRVQTSSLRNVLLCWPSTSTSCLCPMRVMSTDLQGA